jgi:hypothetical protein
MPQWISDIISVWPWLGALAVVWFVVWKCGPTVRKWSRFIDRVTGVPADPKTGQQEVLGLFERMDHQDAQLAEQSSVLETIRHEVEFNNGSSVKDAIIRTENQNLELGEKIDAHLATCLVAAQSTTINVIPGGQT